MRARWCESDCRQAAESLLLERESQSKTACDEIRDDCLGCLVIGDGHGDVNVACKTRFNANGNSQTANQGPGLTACVERVAQMLQSR
jgi:hypothetical protein